MRPSVILTGLLAVAIAGTTATLCAATNQTISVVAKPKDNPQQNPSDVEGHFTNSPTADKDEIHVTNNNVKGKDADVYADPVDDGAQLTIVQDLGPVKVDVEGRDGIGAIYWVTVFPTDGIGSGPLTFLWADVEDMEEPGALVLKDKNSGRSKSDSTNTDTDTPTLYACTAADGKGDVEFWLITDSGTYNWVIKEGTTTVASGTLVSTTWKSEKLNLDPEEYTLSVTKTGDPDFKRTIDFVVVELASVTVESGATQTNVTGVKNWAAVKHTTEKVIVKAVLNPDVTSVPDDLVSWTGGSAVTGQPLQRTVSKATSAKTRVTATCGTSSDYVDVWILWATVTIKMTGTTPANAVHFGALYDGTENLGAKSFVGGSQAVGKVVPVATLTPTGVNAVVQTGWDFDRERWWHQFSDGVKYSNSWDTTWQPDHSAAQYQMLVPDANDKIYDRDAPNIPLIGTDSHEKYLNLRQWVTWNGTICSDYAGWYWKAWLKDTESPKVTLKVVGSGSITLPGENDAHYSPP